MTLDLRWEGDDKNQYLFAGDNPRELAWLEKRKVQWSGVCWLPGIDVGKEYNTLAAHQKNLAAKVEHWFQLALPSQEAAGPSEEPVADAQKPFVWLGRDGPDCKWNLLRNPPGRGAWAETKPLFASPAVAPVAVSVKGLEQLIDYHVTDDDDRMSLKAAVSLPPSQQTSNGFNCEACGTGLIDQCYRCGAPQCCPKCCAEDSKAVSEPVRLDGIADAVVAWMVKYNLLDAGNEYHAGDIVAVLNDLAPANEKTVLQEVALDDLCRTLNEERSVASDMLAALKQVESEMRAGFGSSFGETREQVRRAIAKATNARILSSIIPATKGGETEQ